MFYQLSHLGTSDHFQKEWGENFNYPPHLHQCFELILVTDGIMNISIDEKKYSLGKNQAVFIFPNQLHSMSSVCSKHVLFIFAPQYIQAYWTERNDSIPDDNKITPDEHLIQHLLSLSSDSSKFEIKGILYSICAQIDRNATYEKNSVDRQTLLFKILSYIEKNFVGDCSLGALTATVGYNAEYISRFFKKKMNLSYNQYLNIRRLNHAAHLLRNTNETALHCALESGYTSLRTFNRNFKLYYGVTPQEYRKSAGLDISLNKDHLGLNEY